MAPDYRLIARGLVTALAKTLVMALYGKISPGEMALVRGEGLWFERPIVRPGLG